MDAPVISVKTIAVDVLLINGSRRSKALPRRLEVHEDARRKTRAGMKFMLRTDLRMTPNAQSRTIAHVPQNSASFIKQLLTGF
jgi:hypothetical protein